MFRFEILIASDSPSKFHAINFILPRNNGLLFNLPTNELSFFYMKYFSYDLAPPSKFPPRVEGEGRGCVPQGSVDRTLNPVNALIFLKIFFQYISLINAVISRRRLSCHLLLSLFFGQ